MRAVIDELDRAAVAASRAQVDAERAFACHAEAGRGGNHPQASIARDEARVAADKSGKTARLLAQAASAFAEYLDQLAPGAVPMRTPLPEAMQAGASFSEPGARGPLMKRLSGRLATTRNADDGLQGIGKIGNNAQEAVRPGGAVVPRSSAPFFGTVLQAIES